MENRCSKMVPGEGRFGSFYPARCRHRAKVERDGKPYCAIHDPEYVKAKEAKHELAYKTSLCTKCNIRQEKYWRYCPFCGTQKGAKNAS